MFTWSLCVQNVHGMEMSKLKFWLRAWENQVGMIEYFHPVLSQKVKVNIFKRLYIILFFFWKSFWIMNENGILSLIYMQTSTVNIEKSLQRVNIKAMMTLDQLISKWKTEQVPRGKCLYSWVPFRHSKHQTQTTFKETHSFLSLVFSHFAFKLTPFILTLWSSHYDPHVVILTLWSSVGIFVLGTSST